MKTIPDEIFNQHIIALGKTGAGKSYTLRGLVERLMEQKRRVCIVDPKGDWWGLKSSASGKSAGYPVVIFGGDHADVPLNAHCGAQIAELVASGNRPCILDFGGWQVGERTRFWIDFAAGLFRHNKGPLWLVMDEVHNFAPQGKILDPDAGRCLHWTNRLASEGRGKGIHLLMASQRPQKVHKDTLTCAETLIAMRVLHPLDRGAVKEWIDGVGDPAKSSEVLNSIANMSRGEGYVWSPEIKFFERVTFPKITTFDSFAAPTEEGKTTPKGWAEVDLEEVRASLSQVVAEAKANDPAELKREVARLKRELETRPAAEPVVKEVSILTDDDREKIQTLVSEILHVRTELDALAGQIGGMTGEVGIIREKLGRIAAMGTHQNIPRVSEVRPDKVPSKIETGRRVKHVWLPPENGLDGAQQKIIDTSAMLRARGLVPNREMLARWMDIHPNGGRYNSNLAALRAMGLMDGCDLTEAGRANARPMNTGIHAALESLDGSQCEILGVLESGAALSREELAAKLGIHPNGGRYNSNLSRLRTMGLIPERGTIKLTEAAFA